MKPRRPSIGFALSAIAALALLGTSGCAAWRIKQATELARLSEPFEVAPPQPVAWLLVVGDSTAVGTGASAPAHSVAGLIAQDYPRVQIVNRAEDGAKFADVVRQLQAVGEQRFDLVLIMAGGNDVIRLTGADALEEGVLRTAQLASARGKAVVFFPSGNVGNAPFFFAPVSWLMSQRSRALHKLIRQVAADQGAGYVNLYKEKAQDPFVEHAAELHAKDGLHPSDAGYRIWYAELIAQSDLASLFAGSKTQVGQ